MQYIQQFLLQNAAGIRCDTEYTQ